MSQLITPPSKRKKSTAETTEMDSFETKETKERKKSNESTFETKEINCRNGLPQLASRNLRPATCVPKLPQLASRNLRPETCVPKFASRILRPKIFTINLSKKVENLTKFSMENKCKTD